MQILGPKNEKLKVDDVAKLPDVPAPGENPVCGTNGCDARPQADGFCRECGAAALIEGVSRPARPSIEVALDSHASISPRLEAFILRMRCWDMRKAPKDSYLEDAINQLELQWDRVCDALMDLRHSGFVAKTTPVSRLAATLKPGDPVALDESLLTAFRQLYSQEELDNLTVVRVTATHAVVRTPEREVGPVKLTLIEPKEK